MTLKRATVQSIVGTRKFGDVYPFSAHGLESLPVEQMAAIRKASMRLDEEIHWNPDRSIYAR